MRICTDCGHEMNETRGAIRYDAQGLPHVTLNGVLIRECPHCGNRDIAIPAITQMHRVLAVALAQKPGRLLPAEIQFLRKSLGWSTEDFARKILVLPVQPPRWENGAQKMSQQSEVLLRLMVLHNQRIDRYLDAPDTLPLTAESPAFLPLNYTGDQWRQAA